MKIHMKELGELLYGNLERDWKVMRKRKKKLQKDLDFNEL